MNTFLNKIIFSAVLLICSPILVSADSGILINHNCTQLEKIPAEWIKKAKTDLRIFYGHTSHGGQLLTGLEMIRKKPLFMKMPFIKEHRGDLGENGDLSWVKPTREYLGNPQNPKYNVVMWSWCYGVQYSSVKGINIYLDMMNKLDKEYPSVTFVYMTGHLDGKGSSGRLHQRNNQIREYCKKNNKVLFDFADIETYDPDGNSYLDLGADDSCNYDGGNWAEEWCKANKKKCPGCVKCSHSHCLNCYQKGKAFWWLLSRIAGWDGT